MKDITLIEIPKDLNRFQGWPPWSSLLGKGSVFPEFREDVLFIVMDVFFIFVFLVSTPP